MELKVWVEGIQRIVCGVTQQTTCQDVVFALAHATGKIGRFTLIERWRNNERLLAPQENPLRILMKWGEYSNDVQFILQRSDQTRQLGQHETEKHQNQSGSLQVQQQTSSPKGEVLEDNISNKPTLLTVHHKQQSSLPATNSSSNLLLREDLNNQFRKSFGYSDGKHTDNIGIVRGIPQIPIAAILLPQEQQLANSKQYIHSGVDNFLQINVASSSCSTPDSENSGSRKHNNSLEMYTTNSCGSSADVPMDTTKAENSNILKTSHHNLSTESLLEFYQAHLSVGGGSNNSSSNNSSGELYKQIPPISSNGALVPPPYRDPPPPRCSPLHQKSDSLNSKKYEYKENINLNAFGCHIDTAEVNDKYFQNDNYTDLIQLIKYQREKINLQQADLTKFDAEIVYLENRERDQLLQIDVITREINKTDQLFRQGSEQLQTLQYVEEENELVRQQEKTLKSEITLLRSKLANCETELLQCKNKIRLLMDDIQVEKSSLSRQNDNREQLERRFISEVDRIQVEIDHAIQNTEMAVKTTDNLKKEVAIIECAIADKKKQVEQLVNEMKEVNLQSLAVAPSEEIRHLLEGSNRAGSTRRIIGSPRQLENAVPTSKNPHGVWV